MKLPPASLISSTIDFYRIADKFYGTEFEVSDNIADDWYSIMMTDTALKIKIVINDKSPISL